MMFTLLGNNYIFFLYKEPCSSYPSKMPGLSQEQKLEILILMGCFNPEFRRGLDSSFVKSIPSLKLTYGPPGSLEIPNLETRAMGVYSDVGSNQPASFSCFKLMGLHVIEAAISPQPPPFSQRCECPP